MANAAYDSPVDFPPKEQIEEAEARLYALAEHGKHGGAELTAAQIIAKMRKARESDDEIGLDTPFPGVTAKIGSLQPGNVIVVGGRPGMGKTSFATAFPRHLTKTPIHFFSLEMSDTEIMMRMISEETGIPLKKLRGRMEGLSHAQREEVREAEEEILKQPLIVDQTGGIAITQLCARARRVKRQHGTQLIIIDYVQLITGTKRRGENRTNEISEITMAIKALAKELQVPVLALSQLSRAVENREDKRPQLADLRESGSIEQDADIVLFLYREEYYLERLKPSDETGPAYQDWFAKIQKVGGLAELIVGKHRHDSAGIVRLQFDGSCTRFSDIARSHEIGMRQASNGAHVEF
jgi:replicative DNA helicase